jgi:hypothetical protein
MKITSKLACDLAKRVTPTMTWDDARDMIDTRTDGELDQWQLDTLTDWVLEAYKLILSFNTIASTPVLVRYQGAKIIPFPLQKEVR